MRRVSVFVMQHISKSALIQTVLCVSSCMCASSVYYLCVCLRRLEKVHHVPVSTGTDGLWFREVWMAGTAGCLQGPGVWPRPCHCRFVVFSKHLHTWCQDPSQRLIKTVQWNPCEVPDQPTLRQQPATYLCAPQTHTHSATQQNIHNNRLCLSVLCKSMGPSCPSLLRCPYTETHPHNTQHHFSTKYNYLKPSKPWLQVRHLE